MLIWWLNWRYEGLSLPIAAAGFLLLGLLVNVETKNNKLVIFLHKLFNNASILSSVMVFPVVDVVVWI